MADLSLDARRAARDQESRIGTTIAMGVNAVKPFVMFQTSMLRAYADNLDLIAKNVEKGFEAFDSQSKSQSQQ